MVSCWEKESADFEGMGARDVRQSGSIRVVVTMDVAVGPSGGSRCTAGPDPDAVLVDGRRTEGLGLWEPLVIEAVEGRAGVEQQPVRDGRRPGELRQRFRSRRVHRRFRRGRLAHTKVAFAPVVVDVDIDRLWFFTGYEFLRRATYVNSYYNLTPTAFTYTPDLNHQAVADQTGPGAVTGRLTWEIDPKNKLTVGTRC